MCNTLKMLIFTFRFNFSITYIALIIHFVYTWIFETTIKFEENFYIKTIVYGKYLDNFQGFQICLPYLCIPIDVHFRIGFFKKNIS